MKIDFELPVAFRGRPNGCRGVRDILVPKKVSADIPEISLADTHLSFTVAHRKLELPTTFENERQYRRTETALVHAAEPFEMRAYDGYLYRRIARSVDEAVEHGLFVNPFERWSTGRREGAYGRLPQWEVEYGGDISPANAFADNGPLSRPLVDELEWMMDRDGIGKTGAKDAYPYTPLVYGKLPSTSPHAHRNGIDFDRVIDLTKDVDHDFLRRSLEMVEAQIDKLIVIEGEVWLRSRQPAICVDREFHWRGQNNIIENVRIRMVTAPEVFVSKLGCGHFSLADIGEARSYAEELRVKDKGFFDSVVPFECDDEDLLDYDWRREEVNRFCYAAAVECVGYLRRNPAHGDRLDTAQAVAIGQAYEVVKSVNHVLGKHRDMTEFAPALVSAWRKLGFRQSLVDGITHAGLVQPMANRIERYLEEMPISMAVAAAGIQFPGAPAR